MADLNIWTLDNEKEREAKKLPSLEEINTNIMYTSSVILSFETAVGKTWMQNKEYCEGEP